MTQTRTGRRRKSCKTRRSRRRLLTSWYVTRRETTCLQGFAQLATEGSTVALVEETAALSTELRGLGAEGSGRTVRTQPPQRELWLSVPWE
jgi:hypothetical protein